MPHPQATLCEQITHAGGDRQPVKCPSNTQGDEDGHNHHGPAKAKQKVI